MKPLLKKILQIGIATRDLKGMVRRYQEVYGVEDWIVIDGETGFDPTQKAQELMVRGQAVDFEISLAKAMIGDVEIELIQPLDDKSDYALFLREHGEGVHHISVDTDVSQFQNVMEERGVEQLIRGTVPHVETFIYYDTVPEIGMTVEIHDLVTR
ncbi:MAG: VOC family protein [Lachnospiraceae bacterium]|nr:VOC family protein [Lachnospiraceae bacterium]